MERVLKISELISTDIRSRVNANIIREAINGTKDKIVLDFSGVVFISRSFTDELYNIKSEKADISFTHVSDIVQSMIDAVFNSRKHKRNYSNNNSEMKRFNDLESLSSYLSTI